MIRHVGIQKCGTAELMRGGCDSFGAGISRVSTRMQPAMTYGSFSPLSRVRSVVQAQNLSKSAEPASEREVRTTKQSPGGK